MYVKKPLAIFLSITVFLIFLIPVSSAIVEDIHQSYEFTGGGDKIKTFGGKNGMGQVFNQSSEITSGNWSMTHVSVFIKNDAAKLPHNDVRVRVWLVNFSGVPFNEFLPTLKLSDSNISSSNISGIYQWITVKLDAPIAMNGASAQLMGVTLDAFGSNDAAYLWFGNNENLSDFEARLTTNQLLASADDSIWQDGVATHNLMDGVFFYRLISECDESPPTLNYTQPINESSVSDEFVTVAAGYFDPEGVDLDSVTLEIDGINQTENSTIEPNDISFTPSVAWENGEHIVRLNLSDVCPLGLIGSFFWTFEKITSLENETNPPVIDFVNPFDGQIINDTSPIISANYSDDTGIDEDLVWMTVNGINVTVLSEISQNGIIFFSELELLPGVYNVQLFVTDNSPQQNQAFRSWNFTIFDRGDDDDDDEDDDDALSAVDEFFCRILPMILLILALIILFSSFAVQDRDGGLFQGLLILGAFLLALGFILWWLFTQGFCIHDVTTLALHFKVIIVGALFLIPGAVFGIPIGVERNTDAAKWLLGIGIAIILIGLFIWMATGFMDALT